MKFSKRFISSAVILALLVVVMSACSSNSGNTASQTGSQQGSIEQQGSEPISFSYVLPGKFLNWMQDLAWYPEFTKNANAQIDLINGGDNDQYYQNIDLKVGSGDLKDAAIANIAQTQTYGAQGAFTDLKPLIEKYAPNLKKYLDENPDYTNLVTSSDGKIYGICAEYPKISYVTFYREDMFTKAGITQAPASIAEFTDALVKLKATYGSDQSFYPFTGRDGFLRFAEYFNANDQIDSNGKVHGIYNNGLGYDVHSTGFKDMIAWYADLYQKKLIDPEWVAGTNSEDSWGTKMLTGKGAVSDDFFTRPTWFMTNGGPSNDKNYSIKVMPAFKDASGAQVMRPTYAPIYNTDRFMVVSSKSKNAISVVKLLDFIYSDKGREIMDYGVEGTSYEVKDGQKQFTYDWGVEAAKPLGTVNNAIWQDRLTFPLPVDNNAYYNSLDAFTKSYCVDYFTNNVKAYPQIKYTADQLKERSNLKAKVETEFNADILNFVTGKTPMSDWDAFVTKMTDQGYDKVTAIDQAAFDAMKK